VTKLAGALLRGLHLAASLKSKAQLVIQLHALQKAPLSRSCLRQLSQLLTLIKVCMEKSVMWLRTYRRCDGLIRLNL